MTASCEKGSAIREFEYPVMCLIILFGRCLVISEKVLSLNMSGSVSYEYVLKRDPFTKIKFNIYDANKNTWWEMPIFMSFSCYSWYSENCHFVSTFKPLILTLFPNLYIDLSIFPNHGIQIMTMFPNISTFCMPRFANMVNIPMTQTKNLLCFTHTFSWLTFHIFLI